MTVIDRILNFGVGLATFFISLAGAAAVIFVIGSMFEIQVEKNERLYRCQKTAVTPYEYHQCK